jgi:hypothetical protein
VVRAEPGENLFVASKCITTAGDHSANQLDHCGWCDEKRRAALGGAFEFGPGCRVATEIDQDVCIGEVFRHQPVILACRRAARKACQSHARSVLQGLQKPSAGSPPQTLDSPTEKSSPFWFREGVLLASYSGRLHDLISEGRKRRFRSVLGTILRPHRAKGPVGRRDGCR